MEATVRNKLADMGLPVKESGGEFILTTCLNPNHHDKHPSFSINLSTGACKCFSCGYHLDKDFWLDGDLSEDQIADIERRSKFAELKDSFKTDEEEDKPTLYLPFHSKELEAGWRGLTAETIEELGIYVCERGHYADRVVFPMKDPSGNVVAFNTRATKPEVTPKYKYSKGIPMNELIYPPIKHHKGYIVVVEGILDAISMNQDGIPAMLNYGVNNTIGPKKVAELLRNGVEVIYFGLDNDVAGIEGYRKYLESDLGDTFELQHAGKLPDLLEFYVSKCKDYSEYLELKIKENHDR